MKIIIHIFFSINILSALTISVQEGLKYNLEGVKNLKEIKTKGTKESFHNIENSKSDLAIVRGDILFLAQKQLYGFNYQDYSILTKIKKESYLYLIGNKNSNVKDIYDLRKKQISIGNFSSFNNYHLKRILNNLKEAQFSIHFYSLPLIDSLDKIYSGKLDFIFSFSDKDFSKIVRGKKLKNIQFSKKIRNILLINKGLYYNNQIKANFYLICSNALNEKDLTPLVKFLKETNSLSKKIDPIFGEYSPYIQTILENIKIVEKNKIEKNKLEKKAKYLYNEIVNLRISAIRKIVITKSLLNKMLQRSALFKKESQKLIIKGKVSDSLDVLKLERDKINIRFANLNNYLSELKVDSLITLKKEIQTISENLIVISNSVKSNTRDLEITLAQEKEAAALVNSENLIKRKK